MSCAVYCMAFAHPFMLVAGNLNRRVEEMGKLMESERKEQERNFRLAYSWSPWRMRTIWMEALKGGGGGGWRKTVPATFHHGRPVQSRPREERRWRLLGQCCGDSGIMSVDLVLERSSACLDVYVSCSWMCFTFLQLHGEWTGRMYMCSQFVLSIKYFPQIAWFLFVFLVVDVWWMFDVCKCFRTRNQLECIQNWKYLTLFLYSIFYLSHTHTKECIWWTCMLSFIA